MIPSEIPAATADQLGYCDNPCNGPIIARSRVHLFVSWLCYRAVMALPKWPILDPLMFALLPRAGDIAYACTCRDKIAAAIAKAGEA